MNYEQLLQDIKQIYEANLGQKLSDDDAAEVLRALLSVRDTAHILESAPRHLLQIIFENKDFYNKCVYPCDIVELRGMLGNGNINTQSKIIVFAKSCADRIIRDHKVKLVLNADPQKLCSAQNLDCKFFGGIAVIDSNFMEIADKIHCVVVESKGYQQVETVEKIVADLKLTVPVYTTSIIPGIDKYKFASNLNKYIINLKPLGIRNRIAKANTPLEALDEELKRRWNFHPNSEGGTKARPDNYHASYWEKSGFFDSIVKKASVEQTKLDKIADASSGSMHNTGGRMSGEGSTMDFVGSKSMKRYEPGASAAISKGDIYYSKEGGMINKGTKYVVIGIYSDNTVVLKDENGKKIKVDIGVALPAKFRKA